MYIFPRIPSPPNPAKLTTTSKPTLNHPTTMLSHHTTTLTLLLATILLAPGALTSALPQGIFTYTSWKTLPAKQPQPTLAANACPTDLVNDKTFCPAGCIAAPAAGALGIATDKWKCDVPAPTTSWTSVLATSTCAPGSSVHEYRLWGGQTRFGCKPTGAS